ncbi:maleylpyruvate isomerase family mycothiol-dependent enzyme [Cellulomonas telluris]|uniref:maleylpyruvate isomerase family mycothiol-dependent enzyme n=1 Tax=Cellulomonas telluris TaxID=2306636 RepID=UPI0010A77AD9|nr:maleylpyruvate isomerase family mycothiol-dependent enzyme [Cellulomonas telluris]
MTTPALTEQDVRAAVRDARLRLADTLAALPPEAWSTPSLAAGWTVRDVAAHLTTTTRETWADVLREAVRARFSFDRMTHDVAVRRARAFTPGQLVAQLRESAASDRRMPMSGPMDPLMDLVVHALDVGRPLGLPDATPPDVAVAVASYLAGNRLMGGPRRRAGLRLEAADVDWSVGDGPVVRGPVHDLLLVLTGRPAGFAALTGDGVATLRGRVR